MTNKKLYRQNQFFPWATLFLLFMTGAYVPLAKAEPALKIDGKTLSLDDLQKDNQARFYAVEQKKFELIREIAQEKYLMSYFSKRARQQNVSLEKAREEYLDAKSKVAEPELREALERFKDNPGLKGKNQEERQAAVKDYLRQSKIAEALREILQEGIAHQQMQILYPEPQEPIYPVAVTSQEPVRYGPDNREAADGCQGETCAITVVEYSDFECPFCERAQGPSQEVLKAYRGKIRWIVRDFPLDSHSRSKPAAIAAHCAKEQGKYWPMYKGLFQSYRNLNDGELNKIADRIGLDRQRYESCVSQPSKVLALIQNNLKTGEQLGVTGTPTYFVNGRRVSGAIPFPAFKRLIDESLVQK